MIHRKRVTTHQDPLFRYCWSLYLSAFPHEERRELDYHIETMDCPNFHCEAILDSEEPIGLLFWWDLANFTFIEHLATDSAIRGRGYGNMILKNIISESAKPILLEVEHPTNDISIRRIEFYKRMGFVLNHHQYRHPSYQQIEGKYVDLMVMTHPIAITQNKLQEFINHEFPTIHFRSF